MLYLQGDSMDKTNRTLNLAKKYQNIKLIH